MFRVIMALVMLMAVAGAEWQQYDDGEFEFDAYVASDSGAVFLHYFEIPQGSIIDSIWIRADDFAGQCTIISVADSLLFPNRSQYLDGTHVTCESGSLFEGSLPISHTDSTGHVWACLWLAKNSHYYGDTTDPDSMAYTSNPTEGGWGPSCEPNGDWPIRIHVLPLSLSSTTWGAIKAAF